MKLWSGSSGWAWVEAQVPLEQMFEPLESLLVAAVRWGADSQVLDVGCGMGSTTLALARRLGAKGRSTPEGDRRSGAGKDGTEPAGTDPQSPVGASMCPTMRCVGIDISEPMLAVARARAEQEQLPVTFLQADAQTYEFEPASFDMLISRFGVMFFDDPVRAFANLRSAAKDGAEFRFVAWRSPAENPFMTTAERAAAPLLPNIPTRPPGAPGQFAFADQKRVYRILQESGWTEISIQPLDVVCTFPEKELVRYITWMGPVGRALREMDDGTRARVVETVRAAFESFVHGAEVRFTAACWMVSARAPSGSAAPTRLASE